MKVLHGVKNHLLRVTRFLLGEMAKHMGRFPLFSTQRVKLVKMADICIAGNISDELVCKGVPQNVYQDAVFVVDLERVQLSDLTTDGVIWCKHTSPVELLAVEIVGRTVKKCRILPKGGAIALTEKEEKFVMRRQYSRSWSSNRTVQLSRIISKFFATDDTPAKYAMVQYKVDGEGNGLSVHQEFQKSHGNSKTGEPYIPTFKSVLQNIKDQAPSKRPKQIINNIIKDAGGMFEMESVSSVPRNRRQVYNAIKNVDRPKARNTGRSKVPDFTKLQSMLSNQEFVKDLAFRAVTRDGTSKVSPTVFATTDNQAKWIKAYCSSHKPLAQLGLDMTYKCGPFYVTTATLKHPMFVKSDDKNAHPGIVAAVLTSATKEYDDYKMMSENLKRITKTLVFGTDGEVALESAFKDYFPIAGASPSGSNIHLRCFKHVESDMKRKLGELGCKNSEVKEIVKDVLGTERNGIRVKGLVDAADDKTFRTNFDKLKKNWPKKFIEWLEHRGGRQRCLLDTMSLCMLKPVRVAAGLGNPPNKCFNNVAEALHNVIKEELNHDALDVVAFLEKVKERVFDQQLTELIRGIQGTGGNIALLQLCNHMLSLRLSGQR